MPDEPAPMTTKAYWLGWLAQQGIAIIVLIGTTCALGYYLYKAMPERDNTWAKVVKDLNDANIKDRDEQRKTFLEYRVKSEERFSKALTDLLVQKDKDIDRVVSLLTSRINDVQRHSERTAAKVETLMP